MTTIKAVVFDMGGVFLKYPDPGVLDRIMKIGELLVIYLEKMMINGLPEDRLD